MKLSIRMLKDRVPNFIIFSFIILNIGIVLLWYYYINKEEIKLSDIEKFLGEYITVSGDVVESRISSSGNSYLLKISDGSGYVYVVHRYKEFRNCSRVIAKGFVSEFKGNIYIHVNKKRDIICLR